MKTTTSSSAKRFRRFSATARSSTKRATTKLRLSTKPAFDFIQRWFSRLIWGEWFAEFLVREGLGDLPYTPWRTLSETAWDLEKEYPGTQAELEDFLLGLVIHIRYRDTLESSIEFAKSVRGEFDDFVLDHGSFR